MTETKVDLSKYENRLGRKHQMLRLLWSITWTFCASWLPRSMFSGWKRFLLRLFGARIDSTAIVYSSANVYYPANLTMGRYACMADGVECYNAAPVVLKDYATVSQGAWLCTASHDVHNANHPLITAPIIIEDQAWIGARAFVGLGVTIGQGAVVGATASVYKNVEPWIIVGGNPAKFIRKRDIRDA